MGWFGRRRGGTEERDDHVEPVAIDLGLQKEFEAELEAGRLQELGLRVHLLAQSENPKLGALYPKHCRLYVHPDDELRTRAELASSGFL